jgi:hypothetical protein
MPGVVEAVYTLIGMPERFDVARKKHRIGLRQSGSPITSVPTLNTMLEIVFCVLEGNFISVNKVVALTRFAVLRYLRSDHQVIHRDISKGYVYRRADNPQRTSGVVFERLSKRKCPLLHQVSPP